jgi:5,10-methylene-tetrahydrofolate dehydrogenase/methenyl tetrahydrofolate cyclohydrolase
MSTREQRRPRTDRCKLPVYMFPESAAKALAAMYQYSLIRNRPEGKIHRYDVRSEEAEQIVTRAKAEGRKWLLPSEVEALLADYGFEMPRSVLCLNVDAAVSGLILQMPLPKHINAAAVQLAISPDKDVEGMHPENMGRLLTGGGLVAPCTPMAAMELLRRACPDLAGKEAVVVGRSTIVGKPIAMMLLQMDISATVTVCHSRTKDLAGHTRRAEVLVAATGLSQSIWQRYQQQKAAGKAVGLPDLSPLISADMVAQGAVVIDVATNYIPAGFDEAGEPLKDERGEIALKSVGDVDFQGAMQRA